MAPIELASAPAPVPVSLPADVQVPVDERPTSTCGKIVYRPFPLQSQEDPEAMADFGAEILSGFDVDNFDDEDVKSLHEVLCTHGAVLFRDCWIRPESQYKLTKAFDPASETYGHGNNKIAKDNRSVLHPDLKTLPNVPQVQLIGHGPVTEPHEGLVPTPENPIILKHPSHKTFHRDPVSDEDDKNGVTRFYRWHIDAAFYDRLPPRVTTLTAVETPAGKWQKLRYDDGTGDEFMVPPGGTAFASGGKMFDILPDNLKSLAVRSKVRYAPHAYTWMCKARALPTGLGLYSEGLELPREELPEFEESKVLTLPLCWKNPVTGKLHLQTHGCCVESLIVDPIPEGKERPADALYPDGGALSLEETRKIVYAMQRPGIAPGLVYVHEWVPGDLVLFANRLVTHSVLGGGPLSVRDFDKPAEDQDWVNRKFHQCNLAATQPPQGPSAEDLASYA